MSSPKTKCTELSVGFGLLEVSPIKVNFDAVERKFRGTLTKTDFDIFQLEYERSPSYYEKFWSVGQNLNRTYFAETDITHVAWEGYQRQASTVSVPRDLTVAGIPISIKADSNVLYNRSPQVIFESIPSGTSSHSRTSDWFLHTGREEFQALYCYARDSLRPDLPETIEELKNQTTASDRKRFAQEIKAWRGAGNEKYDRLYRAMCHAVAENSANQFNEKWEMSAAGKARTAVQELFLRTFLRMGDTEYILCGLDNRREFAVLIPDVTQFKRRYLIRNITTRPALEKGQSEVHWDVELVDKENYESFTLHFHVEIRWSHGPFVNNPEGKLYKDFYWVDAPLFQKLLKDRLYRNVRLIGEGGYGLVYEARCIGKKEAIAVKELRRDLLVSESEMEEQRKRFIREVEIQSSLNHPNILPVLFSDVAGIPPWFATPLAPQSLEDIISSIQGDFLRQARIIRQVLEGLRFAHMKNVVHRDLKPSNILIFQGDIAKVSDFGLGKQIGSDAQSYLLTHTSNNSMGTLAYSAPEQLQSARDVDCRADIYALGKTIFHIVSGTEPPGPFTSPALNRINERWRSIVDKCTQEMRDRRYQSIDEIIDAVEQVMQMP